MSPFYFRSVLPPHSDPIGGTPLPAHGAVTHNYDWSQWATLESALPKYVIGGWPRYSAGGDWAEVAVPAHDVRENALDRHRLVCVRPVRARPARDGLRLQLHLVRPQRDGDIHAAVVRSTVLPAGPVRTPHPELRDCGHRRRLPIDVRHAHRVLDGPRQGLRSEDARHAQQHHDRRPDRRGRPLPALVLRTVCSFRSNHSIPVREPALAHVDLVNSRVRTHVRDVPYMVRSMAAVLVKLDTH